MIRLLKDFGTVKMD